MKADESGAPWPYEDLPLPEDRVTEKPTWQCPGGQCQCHPPTGNEERKTHRVWLFDHLAQKMPQARCRVLENGTLVNQEAPYADGDASVAVQVRESSRVLDVEWAPADVPQTARYPFRKRYYIDLGDDRRAAAERRLHNIGFSAYSSLEANVTDFQRAYHRTETGRFEDIEAELIAYHDAGTLPRVGTAGGGGAAPKDAAVRSNLVGAEEDKTQGGGEAKKADGPQSSLAVQEAGPSQQGSAAAVQTTRVRVELHMAFALDETDLTEFDADWPGAPYDIRKVINELYPSVSRKTWRLGPKGAFPVVDATLTVDRMGEPKQVVTSNKAGEAVIVLPVTGQPQNLISAWVEAEPSQQNTQNVPAGPKLTTKGTTAKYLFRPFMLYFGVDETGALIEDQCMVIPAKTPRHARVIEARKAAGKGPNVVVVDWRPDWMRTTGAKGTNPRYTDPRDVPINPFDRDASLSDRKSKSPGGVVIHQTATHNLSFLPGFLSAGTVTSIHYVIDYDGFAIKTLDEHYRANHADKHSVWKQRVGANHFTVGIETMHTDTDPPAPKKGQKFKLTARRFPKEQFDTIARILKELRAEFPVMKRDIRGHMEVKITSASDKGQNVTANVLNGTLSRERIGCPGMNFDWPRMEKEGAALARKTLPDAKPAELTQARYDELVALKKVSEIKLLSHSPEAKLVKELLFDIGYSVSEKVPPPSLTDEYDTVAFEAVRAFQTHYFSGERRGAYTLVGKPPKDGSAPIVGTLDNKTIDAIIDVWWAAQTVKD